MKAGFWLGAATIFASFATAAMPAVAAEPAAEAPPPPPDMPPLPISHHDRPLPLGVTYFGVLGSRCGTGMLADGRRYAENSHGLMPGQTITLKLSSPDFAPLLSIFRAGEADAPLASLSAAADGRSVGQVFTAPDEADYVFRIVGDDASALGRWRLELLYGDKLETGEPEEEVWQEAAGHERCAGG